jgi:AcrR family transcriptional regulator
MLQSVTLEPKMSRRPEQETETGQKLIFSMLNLLDRKPLSQINYREIASGADLSHMTAYRHYKTIDDLLEAIAEEGYQNLTLALSECAEKYKLEPKKLLEQVFLTYFSFAKSNPHHLTAMFDRGVRKGKFKRTSFLLAVQKLLEEYLGIIRICQKGGLLPAHISENELGMMFWSFSHGYATLETKAELNLVMHSRPSPQDFANRGLAAFVAGLNSLN